MNFGTLQRMSNIASVIGTVGIKVSNVTLLRWEARGRFPRRIRPGGTTVAWFMSEIQAWLEERDQERARTHYAEY